jgi:hypothetical protein
MGVLAASCAETASPEENRDAAVYTTVVRWVMNEFPTAPTENPDDLPVVFIEPLTIDTIPIEVQVAMIDNLVDDATVRFTDTRAAAVDEGDPAQPVRAGSILIGLGAIPDGSDLAIRAEVYLSLDEIAGYIIAVEFDGVGWNIEGEPEAAPAEGLIVVED